MLTPHASLALQIFNCSFSLDPSGYVRANDLHQRMDLSNELLLMTYSTPHVVGRESVLHYKTAAQCLIEQALL